MRSSLLVLAAAFQGLHAQTVDFLGITLQEKAEALERQLLGPDRLNFLVSPCSVNFGDDPGRGEQTSAQWVRIVFHDVITKGIAGPGLGGLDASISFESDRAENVGVFVNITIGQFSQFSSAFLSMADLIGVGLSDALAACDQTATPRIPLRAGRIDATQAGPAGVPGPFDSLAFAQAAFTRAGFTNGEMIQAVACGHSLGGVHHSNFPTIVPASQVDPVNNIEGRQSFDGSPADFNVDIVRGYLNGTTPDPLVIGPVASRSDFRIFNSDGNVTMSNMNSPSSFRTTCTTIFTKMINTVPNGVVLSDPIVLRPWILNSGNVDVDASGALSYKGEIVGSGPGTRPNTVSYTYKAGSATVTTKISGTQTPIPIFQGTQLGTGDVAHYAVSDPIATNVDSISIGSSYSKPINNNIFVSESRSFRTETRVDGLLVSTQYVIRAAVKTSLAVTGSTLKARVWYTVSQQNSVAPRVTFQEFAATLKQTIGSYKIYQVVVNIPNTAAGFTSIQAKLYSSSNAVLAASDKLESVFNWPSCSTTPATNC